MRVEVWSDVVCPWCFVGKRRLEAALADFGHAGEVEVVWRSFELDPNAVAEPAGDYAERLARKYRRTPDEARAMLEQMTQTGAEAGAELRFDRVQGGNSFDAHRLLHVAAAHGRLDAMKERLMRAYFTEGRRIGDPDTLVELAADVGLDADEAQDALAGGAYADAVRADEQQAYEYGVSGVPFFVVDGRFAIEGAQQPEVLLRALDRAWEERAPVESG
jgi:predicted DsbA family dithiol-disulfide isomerase